MNKNVRATVITLKSRNAVAGVFSPHSPKRKNASTGLFHPKPLKMHGELLVSRGSHAEGRKTRTKVIPVFSKWGRVIALRAQGYRVLVEALPTTIRLVVPFVD